MNRYLQTAVVLVLAFMASTAMAHPGPRIHIGNSGGKITTYLGNPNTDEAAMFQPKRVFSETWTEAAAGIYLTDFPGFELKSASGVSGTTTFGFSIAGPLRFFDYNAGTNSGTYKTVYEKFSPGVVPQMAFLQDPNPLKLTSTGAVPGFNFFPVVNGHGHMNYILYGNGTSPSDGPDGVYAVPLILTDSAGTLANSDTFWLLLGKDVGTTEFNTAITAADTQLIPEPGMIGVGATGLLLLLRRRRKQGSAA